MTRLRRAKTEAMIMLGVLYLGYGEAPAASTVEEHLVIAAENNPALKAEYNGYLAALEKVPQMGGLPDPQVSFGIFIEPMERYAGDQVGSVSIMQMFPWFGALGAAEKEAALMAEAKYQAFREAKHQLYYEVKTALIDLHLLEREIEVTRKNAELLKSLENIAVIRFSGGGGGGGAPAKKDVGGSARSGGAAAGGGSSSMDGMGSMGGMSGSGSRDQGAGSGGEGGSMAGMGGGGGAGMVEVLWAQMESKELESGLESLMARRKALERGFNRLLGRPLDEAVSLPEGLQPLDLPPALEAAADSGNPMLGMWEAEEEAFAYKEKMNRKMGLPMVGIGLQYDILRSREDGAHGGGGAGHNMLMPMVSMTMPIWRGKYRAAVKEAALQRKAAGHSREDVRNGLRVSLAEIRRDFAEARRRMELYRGQIKLARQALDILMARYTGSGDGFEELLRLQKRVADFELQWEKAVADNNLSVARAERLTGVGPTDNRKGEAARGSGSK